MAVKPKSGNKGYTPKTRLRPNAGFRAFPVSYEAAEGRPKNGVTGPMGASGGKTRPRTGKTTKGSPKKGNRGPTSTGR